MSQVLNEQGGLSASKARDVATVLGFKDSEVEYFETLVEAQCSRSRAGKFGATTRLKTLQKTLRYVEQEPERFDILQNWYNIPLMELVALCGQSVPSRFSLILGISETEIEAAVAKLIEVGALVKKGNKLVKADEYALFASPSPSKNIREYHRQMLLKGAEAVHQQDNTTRVSMSSVLSMKLSQFMAAKEHIQQFNQDFIHEHESSDADAVWGMTVNIFKIGEVEK